jgi:hypothetical protein
VRQLQASLRGIAELGKTEAASRSDEKQQCSGAGVSCLALPPGHVIVDDHLNVLLRLDDMPSAIISTLRIRVDIDHFPITLVLEQQPGFRIGSYLEIWCRVRSTALCFPIVIAQIGGSRTQFLLSSEIWSEIFQLESMGEIDIAGNFLALWIAITEEDDAGEFAWRGYRETAHDCNEKQCVSKHEKEAILLSAF